MNYQEEINLLRCGEALRFDGEKFYANMFPNETPVVRSSRLGKDKLRGMLDNRSVAIKSDVGIVVHWFKQDTQKEYLLPLPTLYLEDDHK